MKNQRSKSRTTVPLRINGKETEILEAKQSEMKRNLTQNEAKFFPFIFSLHTETKSLKQ
jgi:hypothetical protein